MAEQLMRMKEVQEEFGYSRSTLIRYEAENRLQATRTPGGQRRYRRADIERLGQQPDTPTTTDDKLAVYREFGSTMSNRWGSNIYEEKLRELQGSAGRALLHEMRMNDPVIAAVFFAVESSLKRADWRVRPASEEQADKQCAEFIDSCLGDMSFSWKDTLTLILGFLEQGVSLLEVVYKKRLGDEPPQYIPNPASSQHNDGRIGWRKWAPRPIDSLAVGKEWIYDSAGGIVGINQSINYTNSIAIPIHKLLMFRTTIAPANNPWGMPIHRAAYLPYWYSQNIMEVEGIGVERDLAGLPVIYLGEDANMTGPNSDYEMAKELVTNIRIDEQAGIVIPKPKMGLAGEGRGILLELLTSGGRRSHNAQPLDAKVLTPFGWKRMGDIRVGDDIVCPLGYPSKVEGVFPRGKRPVYRITTTDGRTTLADIEHLWVVTNSKWRRRTQVKKSHSILKNHKILNGGEIIEWINRKKEKQSRLHLPDYQPVVFSENQSPLPLDPYLLGILLGDGTMAGGYLRNGEKSINSTYFHSADPEIAQFASICLPNGDIISEYNDRASGKALRYTISGTTGRREAATKHILDGLGLIGTISKTKFIPFQYLWSTIEDRLSLLQGLMDTDGCISKRGFMTYSTSSKKLANDVLHLVRSLGGSASLRSYKITSYYQPKDQKIHDLDSIYYQVGGIRLPNGMIPFRLPRKIQLMRAFKMKYHNAIKSIEYVGETDVQCILVTSPSHMYITDDFIVTHNTNEIIERYDRRKALVVLAQFIMLGMDRTGSFALSTSQADLFNIAIQSWLDNIAGIINRHAIPKLMKLNSFPGITGNPQVVPSPINVPDLAGLALFVNQMVEKEVLTPDDELERHLRQIAGLPAMPEEEQDTTKPGKTGSRSLRGKGLGLEKAALLVRRVGLATRSMTDLGALDQATAAALMEPLIDAMVQSMRNEGLDVPDINLRTPTPDELAARQNKQPPQLNRDKMDEEDEEEQDFPDEEEDNED